MTSRAKITVTTGPDRGKSCAVAEEVVRVGRSPENDLVLSDPQLADHLASIVQREGRYAIITTVSGGVEIDGTEVPVERWVWLPEEAEIRVSRRTSLQFMQGMPEINGNSTGTPSSEAEKPVVPPVGESDAPAARPRRTGGGPGSSTELKKSRRAERGERKTRTVARFITDGPGDPLVKLGEDGHLPELQLNEGHVREGREPQQQKSSPLLVLVAVGVSVVMTVLMLLLETEAAGDNTARKNKARVEIAEYYGKENEEIKPYQIYLRQARQSRGRGDFDGERAEYRKVLNLLRSEAREKLNKYTGITGRLEYVDGDENRRSDRRLEELIAILLSD